MSKMTKAVFSLNRDLGVALLLLPTPQRPSPEIERFRARPSSRPTSMCCGMCGGSRVSENRELRARVMLAVRRVDAMTMASATVKFVDRLDAGEKLSAVLAGFREGDAVVLGMARGGVVVGFAVAQNLNLPLQALVVRKLGAPRNPELAIGAVSETGALWLDRHTVRATNASEDYIRAEIARQVAEARRRQAEYAVGPGLGIVRDKPAIVVDDGIATGASALVAVKSARDLGASQVVLAAPVASRQSVRFLAPSVDQLVVLAQPEPFYAVGVFYEHFGQVTDEEVVDLLRRAASRT